MSELGERFVYPADELFLLVGRSVPPVEHYDAFPQIENGVGMVRRFLDSWERHRGQLIDGPPRPLHLALVTGVLASAFIEPIAAELNALPSLRAEVVAVGNEFFGRGITVSGLLTGVDIAAQLRGGRPNATTHRDERIDGGCDRSATAGTGCLAPPHG